MEHQELLDKAQKQFEEARKLIELTESKVIAYIVNQSEKTSEEFEEYWEHIKSYGVSMKRKGEKLERDILGKPKQARGRKNVKL